MNIPENLQYTKEHEWVLVQGNTATVGITDFAQSELGDIVFVEIETQGEKLAKGATFGTVEAVKTVSDLFMPLTGEVVEVNDKLKDSPDAVNKDPYNSGWMIRISIAQPSEVAGLMSAAQYKELVSA